MSRVVLRIVLQVVLAVALLLVLSALYFWFITDEGPAAGFDQALRSALLFIDIGILTWLVLLIVGGARKRGIGWGFGGSMLAALIGVVVNLIWVVILSIINGGADIFAIALGVQAGLFFLVSVALAEVLVRRVILRS